MKISTRVFMILGLFLIPLSASAAYFQADDQVSVNQPTEGDVYVAGETVTISETVTGDVFAAGASVNITADVAEDLFVAGSAVNVVGNVAGDLRAAGSNLVVSGDVGEELFAAGSLVQLTSTVGGDAHLAGAAVIFDGTVNGDLTIGSSSAIINGNVSGDVTAYAEEIKIGTTAKIDGTLTYYAENEMTFEGASIGRVVYGGPAYEQQDKKETAAWMWGLASGIAAIKLLGILLAGLLIGLLWPKTAVVVTERASKKFWVSLLIGFATVVLVPIATVLLFVTLIGWPIAVALIAASFLLCMVTIAYTGVVVGAVTLKLFKKQQTVPTPTWYNILLGVAILAILALIPVIGWFVILLIYLAILGSSVKGIYERLKKVE